MHDTTKTVLVTGGTGALGSAVTKRLVDEGHRVAVTWLMQAEAERLIEHAGTSMMLVRADVTDPQSIADAVAEVRADMGPIDALVHLVGAWAGGAATHEHPLELWERMLSLNLTSAFLCCRAVLPEMIERDQGRIVLVSSRTAHAARAGQVGYAVAKAGVEVLAETIAEETRGSNVTANVIAPSTIDTPANRRAMPGADTHAWVTRDDVAAAVSFLIDGSAGAMRGAALPLYGGV
jgi:NAD(P)-dependent dehydrogenase (short-subunit alcohol dehydrogenase family)